MVEDRVVGIEDGLKETDHHKASVHHFLFIHNSGIAFQTKLIRKRKVCVGTGDDTVIVNNNQLFVGDLSLSVFQQRANMPIP